MRDANSANEPHFAEGSVIGVLTTRLVDGCLDYLAPVGGVRTGDFVEVPLGNSRSIGVVWARVKARSKRRVFEASIDD